jgi:hypothetical protein
MAVPTPESTVVRLVIEGDGSSTHCESFAPSYTTCPAMSVAHSVRSSSRRTRSAAASNRLGIVTDLAAEAAVDLQVDEPGCHSPYLTCA